MEATYEKKNDEGLTYFALVLLVALVAVFALIGIYDSAGSANAETYPTYTAPTAKDDLIYTGSAQTLVNVGSSSDGTMQYSIDKANWGDVDSDCAKAINAGNYKVYYRVIGDGEYDDLFEESTMYVTATIVDGQILNDDRQLEQFLSLLYDIFCCTSVALRLL